VFGENRALAKLGIQMHSYVGGEELPAFRNKCHYFGDGGFLMSLSDEFAAPYLARGFSVPSMCMAMYGGIRFDPTTGWRLATFMVADVKSIEQYGPDPFYMTSELGLELPDCFANG
jgi:hypothetical protein